MPLPPLTQAQLAGQRVIYSYPGLTPPASLLSRIAHGEAAGVIFFARNVGTPSQFAAAVHELDQAAESSHNPVHLPLLLMTDQEGGVVRRLPGPPDLSARQVGQASDPATAAAQAGSEAAANLRDHGLNVNLAPVLDVYRQAGNFIDQYGRSFGTDSQAVAKLGTAYAAAEQKAGVAATGKHFPGLGAAAQPQDTDLRPVTLPLSASAISGVDERPYRSAIAAGIRLIMLSWAVYPALDPHRPAGLSPVIVGELRHRLGFTGVTVTDAMEAGALRPFGSVGDRAVLAANAGMDLLLCSQGKVSQGSSAAAALRNAYSRGSLPSGAFRSAAARVIALREWLAARA
ncbi:MAG TPA: glycoside hydrolase family 3 N-terminal domain-containing protein [Streptosporangiaceae bacterium]